MRYLGGALDDLALQTVVTISNDPMDPAAKAAMMAQMPNVADPKAKDLFELAAATPYGGHQMIFQFLKGAALGAIVVAAAVALRFGKAPRKSRA
jgi:hypothetical protein